MEFACSAALTIQALTLLYFSVSFGYMYCDLRVCPLQTVVVIFLYYRIIICLNEWINSRTATTNKYSFFSRIWSNKHNKDLRIALLPAVISSAPWRDRPFETQGRNRRRLCTTKNKSWGCCWPGVRMIDRLFLLQSETMDMLRYGLCLQHTQLSPR